MRIVLKIVKWLAALLVAVAAVLAGWLWIAPPALIQVVSAYTAKIVCSNAFIAGRYPQDVQADDVQAPGHPLLKFVSIAVDEESGVVEAGLLGLFGNGLATAREGLGCATVPGSDAARLADIGAELAVPQSRDALWPDGDLADFSQDPAIDAILDDAAMTGPGMRAVVVVHEGRIVGERYGEEFSAVSPLLGWSMTKTVTAAIIGTLVKEGRLSLDAKALFAAWAEDERAQISLADLMAMSSGLEFNEDYGAVTDVVRMLYLEPDMAAFAASRPLVGEIGKTWNYSTGTTVMLSRIWQDAAGGGQAALDWPRRALFEPLGMTSAVLEADASGTFVGSSYLYATARDWARFGLLLLQRGAWNGRSVLPSGYVDWMVSPAPASLAPWGRHEYGRGQVWLHGPTATTPDGEDPDAGFDLPDDAFWLLGHDGQSTVVIPSRELVVVRLGLTPSSLGYKPQAMVEALVKALD